MKIGSRYKIAHAKDHVKIKQNIPVPAQIYCQISCSRN
uniref:Uncharacterized protein n=1 Tax=Rhizophora mucronata TaxID=61149 RepID=A0A2P2KH36_RHIMU